MQSCEPQLQEQVRLRAVEFEQLTADEEDAIFDLVMDPTSRCRRYGFGNQAVIYKNKHIIIA